MKKLILWFCVIILSLGVYTCAYALDSGIHGGIALNLNKITTIKYENPTGVGIGISGTITYFPVIEENKFAYGFTFDTQSIGRYSDRSESDIGDLLHTTAIYTIDAIYITNVAKKSIQYFIFGLGIMDIHTKGYLTGIKYPDDLIDFKESLDVITIGFGYAKKWLYVEPRFISSLKNSDISPHAILEVNIGVFF